MKVFEYSKSRSHLKCATSTLFVAALTALICTSPLAHADNDHKHCDHQHLNQESHREHFQMRQQELHEKLALTANQDAAWAIFVAKTKPSERHDEAGWYELSKLSTPERLDRMLAKTKEREQRLEVRVQATKDLYKQLTPGQQNTFDTLNKYRGDRHDHEESR